MKKSFLLSILFILPYLVFAQKGQSDDLVEVVNYNITWTYVDNDTDGNGSINIYLKDREKAIILRSSQPELINLWANMLRSGNTVFYHEGFKMLKEEKRTNTE